MENNALLAKKSLGKKNIKYLIIVLVAIIFIASFFIYYLLKGPANIADCKDLECVKTFASDENFILEDCESVMPEFKDNCYYIFATENPKVEERRPEEYCLRISDGDIYVECLEHATGTVYPSSKDGDRLRDALTNLNEEKCLELKVTEMRERCLEDIPLLLDAISKRDISLCASSELSPEAKNVCFPAVLEVIENMEIIERVENLN